MVVDTLRCRNIRNHEFSEVEFGPGVNVISGSNGHGKTSLLECIALVSLTKSFVPGPDRSWIAHGSEECDVKVIGTTSSGTRCEIAMHATTRTKEFSFAGSPTTPRALLGTIPVVAMSPDMRAITTGGPAERRRMLDIALSQSDAVYLDTLVRYKKALQHRNVMLKDSDGIGDIAAFDVWTQTLATLGAGIVMKRRQYVEQLRELTQQWYNDIARADENISLHYQTSGIDLHEVDDKPVAIDAVVAAYTQYFKDIEDREMRNGRTLCGPHLDDMNLYLRDMPFREVASQGQHKTMLISLKLAEFSLLRERCLETPIVLFDDVFSELDAERAHNVVEVLARDAQVFVTTTDEHVLADIRDQGPDYRAFRVHQGKVEVL